MQAFHHFIAEPEQKVTMEKFLQ